MKSVYTDEDFVLPEKVPQKLPKLKQVNRRCSEIKPAKVAVVDTPSQFYC